MATPVECARSRETVHRSALAGWAEYGYCPAPRATSGGYGCTLHGLPVGFALSGAKADEREVLLGILDADRAYYGRLFEATLSGAGIELLRPARAGETPRPGARLFKPLRQVIESINDTCKGQLDLDTTAVTPRPGVWVRVLQRVLTLTAAIWHNDHIGAPTPRSLIAYDH